MEIEKSCGYNELPHDNVALQACLRLIEKSFTMGRTILKLGSSMNGETFGLIEDTIILLARYGYIDQAKHAPQRLDDFQSQYETTR